ncbi:glycosyltransferase [Candidatus Woesebacteria bacterium]|nr:glycosyltransferase [Candidatus Woesebacteria bacterium]
MAKTPFFSIIIPALNEEKYLPKLLGDLSEQSFRDFEVIVVDGGSKDKTISMANSFVDKLPKLTVLTSHRAHVCTQRNLGASHATAEVLIFSDADNRLPLYFLQGIRYQWEKEHVELMTTHFDPDKKTSQNVAIANAVNTFFDLQKPFKFVRILESLLVVNKTSFKVAGGFNEKSDFGEGDSFIQSMLSNGYKIQIVSDPTYTFSFRRIRRFGLVGIIGRMARLELSKLLGEDFTNIQAKKLYPMLGGTLFNKTRKSKNKFIKNIQKLIKDF